MNDIGLTSKPKKINITLLSWGILILALYILFSRIVEPFNFLEAYRDFTPVVVVNIKLYMWLLPISFLLISLSLSKYIGKNPLQKVDNLLTGFKRSKFLTAVFIISILETMLISIFVLEGIPHFLDEVVYFFQAKIFAGGHLYAPSPPEGFFDYLFLHNGDGKWFARHFPGFSLILSGGMLLKITRLVNPLLSSFTVLIFFFLILNISKSERIARYSSILILLCLIDLSSPASSTALR